MSRIRAISRLAVPLLETPIGRVALNPTYTIPKSSSVVSNDAIGLKLFFNQFQLSKNALLYIYDESQNMIIGPITSDNNHADNTFSHKLLKGSSIFIEYFVPTTYL